MTRPITTAPDDSARAMHAAEMRGQDMQDAPERIYRQPGFKAEFVTAIPFERAAIPATTYITEAECHRRIDAAVIAEREACAMVLDIDACDLEEDALRFRGGTNPHHKRKAEADMLRKIAAAIRARGQK